MVSRAHQRPTTYEHHNDNNRTDPSVCPSGHDAIMTLVPCPILGPEEGDGGEAEDGSVFVCMHRDVEIEGGGVLCSIEFCPSMLPAAGRRSSWWRARGKQCCGGSSGCRGWRVSGARFDQHYSLVFVDLLGGSAAICSTLRPLRSVGSTSSTSGSSHPANGAAATA